MALALQTSSYHEHQIHASHAVTLGHYVDCINALDERMQWGEIVSKAYEAGLRKEQLCEELSCSWSTVTRWMAGQTAPGPFARAAIKAKLIEMVLRMKDDATERAASLKHVA